MNTQQAIAERILQLCKERTLTPNGLSNLAAVPQATIKSILMVRAKTLVQLPLRNYATV